MRTVTKVGLAASLLWAASAAAKDQYVIHEERPETGSNISKVALTWPVPIERRYGELTGDEQRIVRAAYIRLAADDEPAYPRDGMAAILGEAARIGSQSTDKGWVHLAVRVDATGQPRGVAVLTSPNERVARAVSYVLMNSAYKPALCGGKACESDFSFRYDIPQPRNFLVDWNHTHWTTLRKSD
jgi:hypothetical protein